MGVLYMSCYFVSSWIGCYKHNTAAQHEEQTCQFKNQKYSIKFIVSVSSSSQA